MSIALVASLVNMHIPLLPTNRVLSIACTSRSKRPHGALVILSPQRFK